MKKNKGKLIPIGGGEDKRDAMNVLKTFLNQLKNGRDPNIEILTIATRIPREIEDDYRDAFDDLRFRNYDFIHLEDSRDADGWDYIKRIENADGVFFSGGDQVKLCDVLAGTKFLDTLRRRYAEDGLIIAGTSAGAAAMSVFMIAGGKAEEGLLKGEMRLTSGLGFIDNVIIDTHFTQRGRFARLMSTVAVNPRLLGLGFSEDTAAVISDDIIEVIGSGVLVTIDGSNIKYSNVTSAREGEPVTIEGLTVHLLAEGERFDLKKRKVIRVPAATVRRKKAARKKDRAQAKRAASKRTSKRVNNHGRRK